MALYAYRDIERKNKILAKNARKEDINKMFYCPNKDCKAEMYIKNVDGVNTAYFSAKPHTHIVGCDIAKSSFNINSYEEKSFNFDDTIMSLTTPSTPQSNKTSPSKHGTGQSNLKPLRTMKQIYSMCKAHDYSDAYNGVPVSEMLVDDRSLSLYPRGVFGLRLVECRCKGMLYNKPLQEIYLFLSKYDFTLKFNDKVLYKEIQDIIYNNKDKKIVIAGDWTKSGTDDVFCVEITSKRQVLVLK